jgi:RNA polymerase primary sigma factor
VEIRALKEVQQIIQLGKSKGTLTIDEVNALLPAESMSAAEMEAVVTLLGSLDIDLVDEAGPLDGAASDAGGDADDEGLAADDGAGELDEEPLAIDRRPAVAPEPVVRPSTGALPADPVRYYFSEMSRIPLLGREGEVELARRIEEASAAVRNEAFASPLAAAYVLDLASRFEAGEVDLGAVLDDGDDAPDDEAAAVERAARFHRGVARIRRMVKGSAPAGDAPPDPGGNEE